MQKMEHIRRLIRQLDLPMQADQVLQRPKYWTAAFCWLYFEKCDDLIFDDPQGGLEAAEAAPELVSLVDRFSRDPAPRAPLRLRALGVLGSAYRAVGELEEAEEIYEGAFRLIRRQPVPEEDVANLLLRVAVLHTTQCRLDRALKLADKSVEIYRRSSDEARKIHLGEALTNRGYCHFEANDHASAMKDWSEALSCTDPRRRPRVHHCASHNLACGLVATTIDSSSLAAVESYLRQARRSLSKRPRSLQKLRIVWLQGMIMIRFGSTRRGEAALVAARRGFVEMEAPFDMALVSITLGRYLRDSRQFSQLQTLASETRQLFAALCPDERAKRALAIWNEAISANSVSNRAFSAVWRTVEQCAAARQKISGR